MAKFDHHNKASARDPSYNERKWILVNAKGGYYKASSDRRWTITSNPREATKFQRDKAQNIILNSLPKDQQGSWFVIPINKLESRTLEEAENDKKTQQKELTQDIVINSAETSKNSDLYTIIPERFRNDFDWVGYEADRINLKRDLEEYYQVLRKLEMQNHREEIDLYHKIELGKKPNAVEGYKLLMRFRECLITRRKIKNDILRCEAMLMDESSHQSGEVLRKLDSIDNQRYKPRALNDLFDDEDFTKRKD